MRRHSRGSGGPAVVGKSAAPGSDPMSLIRTFNSETNPSRPVRPSPLAASQIQGMPLDLIDRLRSFPLFQSTPESFLAEIGLRLRPQVNSPNDYILTEGDEAKAMYWLVRGAVSVTSRDGESVYAELKPGAFFGEIGILMDRPRTATIVARTRCLLVVLTKEDFKNILPAFPEVERAIRDEAEERLLILEKKKGPPPVEKDQLGTHKRVSKRVRDNLSGSIYQDDGDDNDVNIISKRRKSPSPGLAEPPSSSALANGLVNVRLLLKELPLFSSLPPDILHFLGLNVQPQTYPPFTDIIRQDSQGREIYFIVRGEVEVINEHPDGRGTRRGSDAESRRGIQIKARLKQGQYFGEVVSLSLAPRRTATVRSVTSVECLMISGEVLSEFWERCPKRVRDQVEETARKRLTAADDNDVTMEDVGDTVPPMNELAINEAVRNAPRRQSMPLLTLTETELELEGPHKPSRIEDRPVLRPSDPDPFLNVGLDNVRSRSRRGSLAPITPEDASTTDQQQQPPSPRTKSGSASPIKPRVAFAENIFPAKQMSKLRQAAKTSNKGPFIDSVLTLIFQYLDLDELLHFRAVSHHWGDLLTKSPHILHYLDLSLYNRKVTDQVLTDIVCPFVGTRPRVIDINNCFHITDEGFSALANTCGANLRTLKMKSVWDVTAPAILEMANKAKGLQYIDLSNCRKVSDTLLARIVGWIVPGTGFGQQHNVNGRAVQNPRWSKGQLQNTLQTAAGTVFGCPYLKRLTLSYCKHVTDRSMHHIASHAASRLEEVDLTRCTTITDHGFQFWGNTQFLRLRKLCLADCTYLTDNAIVYLTNAAKGLQELDLSFCCALSDTATEVLALGCPHLTYLNLSFCGSAVSDPSLRTIGLHLLALRELSVRGCVRVTGAGVESVMENCGMIQVFDVSQCKNLTPWLDNGWHKRYGDKIRYETVIRNGKLAR